MHADENVLDDGQVRKQPYSLERSRDSTSDNFVCWETHEVVRRVSKINSPAARRVEMDDHIEEGRLARAIRTNDRHDLGPANRHGKVVDGPNTAEGHRQILDPEQVAFHIARAVKA